MIKEWATVVSWHNGVAQVHCDVKASCSSCASRAGCGSRVLNKLGPQTSHTISVPCEQPLAAGQKVELGIAESSLLGSAMLVYMAPLAGLFVMASIFQVLFASDIASLCGALLRLPPTWASDFTGPYLYLPFLLQRHNFCGYAGSNSISWFRGCSVECGVFGLKNVRHSTAAS